VVIAAPHTSNWDFVIAMLFIGALRLHVSWLGKHTIFRWPFGGFFRKLGGIPVDRRESQGLVDFAMQLFRTEDSLLIALAPEGTRRRTAHWKTGFYHIAVGADVPIVPAYLDFSDRRVGIGSPLVPTSNMETDLAKVSDFYAPYASAARRPEKFSLRENP